jgi:hypothetical protein
MPPPQKHDSDENFVETVLLMSFFLLYFTVLISLVIMYQLKSINKRLLMTSASRDTASRNTASRDAASREAAFTEEFLKKYLVEAVH